MTFKEGDVVVYHVPSHKMVSACRHEPEYQWEWSQASFEQIEGMTGIVGYSSDEYKYAYVASGRYQVAAEHNDITHYTGVVNPTLFKRTW